MTVCSKDPPTHPPLLRPALSLGRGRENLLSINVAACAVAWPWVKEGSGSCGGVVFSKTSHAITRSPEATPSRGHRGRGAAASVRLASSARPLATRLGAGGTLRPSGPAGPANPTLSGCPRSYPGGPCGDSPSWRPCWSAMRGRTSPPPLPQPLPGPPPGTIRAIRGAALALGVLGPASRYSRRGSCQAAACRAGRRAEPHSRPVLCGGRLCGSYLPASG